MTENLGTAQHFGIELIGSLHVLHRKSEVLDPLESCAKRGLVAFGSRHRIRALGCGDCGWARACGNTGHYGSTDRSEHATAPHCGRVVPVVGHVRLLGRCLIPRAVSVGRSAAEPESLAPDRAVQSAGSGAAGLTKPAERSSRQKSAGMDSARAARSSAIRLGRLAPGMTA